MPRARYCIHENQEPHFLTCTIVDWLPIFTRPETCDIVLDAWRFLQQQGRLVLYGYVILVNHVHFVASSPDLKKEVADFKSFTARSIIDFLGSHGNKSILELLARAKAPFKSDREHQLWREGSHPQQILSEAMLRQKLEYIHDNPVRRGYVEDPLHWRYPSARNYSGLPGLLDVVTDW